MTGRADVTLRHQEAMLDKLEVARVVGRPLSEVIQGGIWEHKVGVLSQTAPYHELN